MSERKLTSEQWTALLARAVERDARMGPREFSRSDLLAAGDDLGLDRRAVEEVWAEHEEGLARRPPAVERPFDTKLRLEQSAAQLRIEFGSPLPTKLLSAAILAFTTFFLYMVVDRLGMGARGMELFEVPFFLVPATIAGMAIWSGFTRTELTLTRQGGRLVRVLGPLRLTTVVHPRHIRLRLDEKVTRHNNGAVVGTRVLALDHGSKTHNLLAGYSVPEHLWVKAEIERWIAEGG